MFEGFARKFFWSTVLSGFLAYGSGVFKGPQKINEFIKEVRQYRKENLSGSFSSASKSPRLNPLTYNGPAPTLGEPIHSEHKYKINEKEYVVIEGKYYEYRPDHVYQVNGKNVFYFNSRARTALDGSEKIAQAAPMAKEPNFAGDVKPLEQAQPIDDDSILDPAAAIKKMRELRSQMDERDHFLNQIGDEYKAH